MGVKGLLPFLRRKFPQVIRQVDVGTFGGKTLALDATLWINRAYYGQYDKRAGLHRWYELLGRLRLNGINAICIFDGPARPVQKYLTNLERASRRRTAGERQETERHVGRHIVALQEARSLPSPAQAFAFTSTLHDLRHTLLEGRPPEQPAQVAASVERSARESDDRPAPPHLVDQAPVSTGEEAIVTIAPAAVDVDADADAATPVSIEADMPAFPDAVPTVPPAPPPSPIHRDHLALAESITPLITTTVDPDEYQLPAVAYELEQLGLESATREVRFGRQAEPMPREFAAACVELAAAFGYHVYSPPVDVPREGEELAASLVRAGHADAVASQDSDVLVHGSVLVSGLEATLDRAEDSVLRVIDPVEVAAALGFDRRDFVDFCILCGTDYPGHLYNIGPNRAYGLLKKHGSIEAVVRALTAVRSSSVVDLDIDDYLADIDTVRPLFLEERPPPVLPAVPTGEPDWPRVDELLDRFEAVAEADNPFAYPRGHVEQSWHVYDSE